MVIRKRLIIWLIKAYIKKSGKSIVLSFFIGLIVFFLIITVIQLIPRSIFTAKTQAIGIAGTYTIQTLPPSILEKIGLGLTTVNEKSVVVPGLASSWEIKDSGKTYTFHLRQDISFHDGKKLKSTDIEYGFSQVSVERPDIHTITYQLKEQYAPFLVTVSDPVFKNGFIGAGDYKVRNIVLNGNFVKSIRIGSKKPPRVVEEYVFYPSQDALRLAYLLGEVSQVQGLSDTEYKNIKIQSFPNVKITRTIHHEKLVTLFYNTKDPKLSDKKLRNALSFSLPDQLPYGQRVYVPYPPNSFYFNPIIEKKQDFGHARILLENIEKDGTSEANLTFTIKTLPKYKNVAEEIAESWKKLSIKTTIEEVNNVPTTFQIYLGDMSLPKDPDQYTIWHSGQKNNITKYINLRVDKLLEDGRKISDITKRKEIYLDFQKYLLDDAPAAFLFFPFEYNVIRK